jgi:hypothetical protein
MPLIGTDLGSFNGLKSAILIPRFTGPVYLWSSHSIGVQDRVVRTFRCAELVGVAIGFGGKGMRCWIANYCPKFQMLRREQLLVVMEK